MNIDNIKSMRIILIAWLAYFVSYLGRTDYATCLLEITLETGIARTSAGIVSSSFAICNAIGQIVSIFIVKKISPVKIISFELFTVTFINLVFPTTTSVEIMAILWGVNGCIQATLLCSVTTLFTKTLKEPYLSKGMVLINTISAVGGVFNYILSYVIMCYLTWKNVFLIISTMSAVVGIAWCIIVPKDTKGKINRDAIDVDVHEKVSLRGLFGSNAACFAMLAGAFVGIFRNSMTLWIPTYMNDALKMDSGFAVMITACITGSQICGSVLGEYFGKKSKNLLKLTFATFMFSVLSFLGIFIYGRTSIILTTILFIINAICMTAALTFVLSLYPIRYFKKNEVVVLVGVINFCVYLGDFFASTGIGWLSENMGWDLMFGFLAICSVVVAVLCLWGGCILERQSKMQILTKEKCL